jgi:hypothetical protein
MACQSAESMKDQLHLVASRVWPRQGLVFSCGAKELRLERKFVICNLVLNSSPPSTKEVSMWRTFSGGHISLLVLLVESARALSYIGAKSLIRIRPRHDAASARPREWPECS